MSQWISGIHAVQAVLQAERRVVHRLYYSDAFKGDRALLARAKERGASLKQVSLHELKRLMPELEQGVLLEAADYPYLAFDEFRERDCSLVLALDEIQDPHNCGALLRTAFALGVDAVLLSKDRTVAISSAVLRSSAGAAEFLPICRIPGLPRELVHLKKQGFWIIGADATGDSCAGGGRAGTAAAGTPIEACTLLGERLVLVMGSEGSGLRETTFAACDERVSIPMRTTETLDSLNVSVAGGILMWEIAKARRTPPSGELL